MTNQTHSGYVDINDEKLAATFRIEGDKLTLEVVERDNSFMTTMPERIELLQFRGSRNHFSLTGLFKRNHQMRLGVGGIATYSAQLALEDVVFESLGQITSDCWKVYLQDFSKILQVTGLEHQISFLEDQKMVLNWAYRSPKSVVLNCPKSSTTIRVGQDMSSTGNMVDGPKISLRYPLSIDLPLEISLEDALTLINRIRLFFSLIMGRVLVIEEASMVIRGDAHSQHHDAKIYGLVAANKTEKPTEKIVGFDDADDLARMLDLWLENFEKLQDAIHLHMDGLSQLDLPGSLRFQIFVQAIESLHRRTNIADSKVIDITPISKALRTSAVAEDVIDRVAGILAHAHEPGLRQRLKQYWASFINEIETLRPSIDRKTFVSKVAATRNFYAHRTEPDDQVLVDSDLWDYTEIIKAISHLALLKEVGGKTDGLGQAMLDNRFTQFVIR